MTLNEDLAKLSRATDRIAFDGLEGAIWQTITTHEAFVRTRDQILRWQVLAVALAVMGSLAGGLYVGREQATTLRLDAFSTHGVPAPSRLLLGDHI